MDDGWLLPPGTDPPAARGGRSARIAIRDTWGVTAPPPPDPFDVGRLPVGDGHVLYYEQLGSPEGLPIVYVPGGPGAGCTPNVRRYFDLARHRAVLFDQRAGAATLLTPADPCG